MGTRGKRTEIEKNLKDRGDSPQKLIKEKDYLGINRIANLRGHLPDCGDTKGKRIKPIYEKSIGERPRSSSPRLNKYHFSVTGRPSTVSQATNTSLDIIILRSKPDGLESSLDEYTDYRTRVRDRYTKRSKLCTKVSLRRELLVQEAKSGDVLKIQSSDELTIRDQSKVPSETNTYDSIKPPRKKPIIKTITSKKDAVRVYKAVTFVDTPQMNTSLQIKVPRASLKKGDFKSRIPKRVKTVNNQQIEQKPKKKVVKAKPVKIPSRERLKTASIISAAKIMSPPTEVAKWSPSQNSTMPYYEAWVDTTLAAISKFSKKDRLFFEKQNILQMFKKQLDYRPETFYSDLDDPRYTGKITVKQR